MQQVLSLDSAQISLVIQYDTLEPGNSHCLSNSSNKCIIKGNINFLFAHQSD